MEDGGEMKNEGHMNDGDNTNGSPTRNGVRATYDRIGTHFAKTRAHAWPAVESFVEREPSNALVRVGLDVGCGNGRHAELLAARAERVVGVDSSATMLSTARERAASGGYAIELAQADAATLPIATDSVDLAVYVATIHHLPDRAARVHSLDELARVLAPGGRALVSAWATTHERFADESASRLAEGFDTTVDWTTPGGEAVPRYYHIYAPAEFEADVEESALAAERVFEERGNCYGVVVPEGKRT